MTLLGIVGSARTVAGSATPTLQGAIGATYNSISPAFTFSASPIENDVIVAVIGSTASAFINAGGVTAGWTNMLGGTTTLTPSDTSLYAAVVWHTVTSGEDAANQVTWTLTNFWTSAEIGDLAAAYIRGANTTAPIDAYGTFTSDLNASPHTLPAVAGGDISTAGLVLRTVIKDGVGSHTTPAGHTQRATSGTSQAVWMGTSDTPASPGVAIASTDIAVNVGDEYISISMVIAPT